MKIYNDEAIGLATRAEFYPSLQNNRAMLFLVTFACLIQPYHLVGG